MEMTPLSRHVSGSRLALKRQAKKKKKQHVTLKQHQFYYTFEDWQMIGAVILSLFFTAAFIYVLLCGFTVHPGSYDWTISLSYMVPIGVYVLSGIVFTYLGQSLFRGNVL